MINIRKLENDLWSAADDLRANSNISSNEYCMPVLGLIFLRYAYSRFKLVEKELMKDRPTRNGIPLPVQKSDFIAKSAIFLPLEAQYKWLIEQPENPDLPEKVNNAMDLIQKHAPNLQGILPKNYNIFNYSVLSSLLRTFNNNDIDNVEGDVIGRIYEYFLNKFAKNIAQDDGVFFTPKSLVKMIVNIIEPKRGILLDPACGSGGMFVQTGDFVSQDGTTNANRSMTFYGQEKIEYNAKLCLMNLAVHGLSGKIQSGDDANTFYNDAHNLVGCCDYVMANPPFNVDKVKKELCESAGRLPFGLPGYNDKSKEFSNGNYLWISYFYAYLNEKGKAGFVMASSATDSANKDKLIRKNLINTGHVDVMISVGNNFFYTKSLPCTLWFFNKDKSDEELNTVLFIDSRNYYTVIDRHLNEWSAKQLKNLNAIVWLYRKQTQKYLDLIADYESKITYFAKTFSLDFNKEDISAFLSGVKEKKSLLNEELKQLEKDYKATRKKEPKQKLQELLNAKTEELNRINALLLEIDDMQWIKDKFPDNCYHDILGLCKAATLQEIEQKDFSLTPGAYVGVAKQETDNENFFDRMQQIQTELTLLQEENTKLFNQITENFSYFKF